MLFAVISPARADDTTNKDLITFTGGQADPSRPGVYIIDGGDYNENGYTVTLSRPKGATATCEASITLSYLSTMENVGVTVTFAPGETTKEVTLYTELWYGDDEKGNCPTVFNVLRTEHADTEYEALILNANVTAKTEVDSCRLTSSTEALQTFDPNGSVITCLRWDHYFIIRLDLPTKVNVSADSRLVLETRYIDHTVLEWNDDDYGMSKKREVVLTPINIGAQSQFIWYLYKPSDDEYMFSYTDGEEYDNSLENGLTRKGLKYQMLEAGPFEVTNPAKGAIQQLFFSRTDTEENDYFPLWVLPYAFVAHFSDISINKTTFKSGETMVITANMDNWKLMKRARLNDFMASFGVSLNGTIIEPYRFSFDETTGMVTYYATAPTVSTDSIVHVDFGPMFTLMRRVTSTPTSR